MDADNGVDAGRDSTPDHGRDLPLADALGLDADPGYVDAVPTVATVDVTIPDGAEPPERLSSVLVAVGSGPHAGPTVDLSREIAAESDAWLELFHVVDGRSTESEGNELLEAARDRLGTFDRVDRWLVDDETPSGAIVEQSAYYDAVVMGAPTSGRVERFVLGSTTGTVLDGAQCPVLVVTADGSSPL